MGYKKHLQKISIIFVAIAAAFIFFSQTLTDLRIPRVNLTFSHEGTVIPEALSSAIILPANTKTIFAPTDGTIIQLAERGYRGSSASIMLTIHSDVESLQELLSQALGEQQRIALNIERVHNDLALERQRMTQPAASLTSPGLVEYDLQLAQNYHAIENARSELAEQTILYNQGIIPRQELTVLEANISSLQLAREQILARRGIAEAAQAEIRAEHNRARANQVGLHQGAISQLEIQLRVHTLELEAVLDRVYKLNAQIEEGGLVEVAAGDNLTIDSIMPGITVGARVSEGMPIMTAYVRNHNFRAEVPFALGTPYVDENRAITISLGAVQVNSRISRVFYQGDIVKAVIYVEESRFSGGERVMANLRGPGVRSTQVIPRNALRVDSRGYYILYVEAVERLFGRSYYARAHRIEGITARGNRYIATDLGFFGYPIYEPIIFNSDGPVYPGDRVRPVEAGDFFDTR